MRAETLTLLQYKGKSTSAGRAQNPVRTLDSLRKNLARLDIFSVEVPMATRKTSVEINEELLESVRRILATSTVKETVERAFQEIVRREAQREEIESLRTMRGMDLNDPEVMAGAWPK